jgi:hypothetical protein
VQLITLGLEKLSLFSSTGGRLNFIQQILKLRWPIIAVVGIIILLLEIVEHPGALRQFDHEFLSEVLFLGGLLIIAGVTINWLLKSIQEKTTTVRILETKTISFSSSPQPRIGFKWLKYSSLSYSLNCR